MKPSSPLVEKVISMPKFNRSSVIVAVDDLTEFYAVQPDIDALLKINVPVQILVIRSYSEQMFEDTKSVIRKYGYDILVENGDKLECKILLEPYRITNDVEAEFRIRYEYGVGPASVKPDPCYTLEWNFSYDVVVCYSSIASEALSAYSKPCIISPQQFKGFKLHKKGDKTNLLILFTWGDTRTAQRLARIKELLGGGYNMMIKVHHAVQYRPDHSGIADMLRDIADEYYDATTNVNQLFEKADIVLTDNSSAVFTAIYLGIPAAIFSEATNDYSNLNGIKAAHFSLLIEPGLVPYTDDYSKVSAIVAEAPGNIDVQNKLKDHLYPAEIKDTLASVIEEYLRMDRTKEPYYILRDILTENIKSKDLIISEQTERLNEMSAENEALKNVLASFLGVQRSARLLTGNIKRRITRITVKTLKR